MVQRIDRLSKPSQAFIAAFEIITENVETPLDDKAAIARARRIIRQNGFTTKPDFALVSAVGNYQVGQRRHKFNLLHPLHIH